MLHSEKNIVTVLRENTGAKHQYATFITLHAPKLLSTCE